MYIIGRGGFGKVWKVRLKKTNEFFALKEMSKVKIIDRRSEISIMSERNLLSNLNHSFIVNMHFAFQDFYNLYLVMDLLTGGDLRYHIAHKRTFSEKQTKFIIANMLLALEYIHSKNIIHRDIKPENLVLDSNGYVRITDFGVAKINEEDNSSETSGTPGYMAPEVILVQNHSFPSDFFALGVIGYEFMLGYRPYLGKGRKEIKQLIISKQAKLKIEEIPDDWSEKSMDFINKLLQRKPVKRLGYNGVEEIKNHPWMKDIDWDLLFTKKIKAPFIPSANKENFDKRYCEGEDNVGEETVERYELYLQSDLYEGVFVNYTYVNMNYISKFDQKQKYKISSAQGSQTKMFLYNNSENKIKNKTNIKNNYKPIENNNNNNNEQELNKNKNPISERNVNNSKQNNNNTINANNRHNKLLNNKHYTIVNNKENKNDENIIININKENNINNKSKFNTIDQTKKENNVSLKYDINNDIEKYNTPMVNENIMCNNYINLNINNYQSNKKNEKIIDVSTIKKILDNNHIEEKIQNDNNINSKNKKENLSINKPQNKKYALSKSSSMKLLQEYNNNYLKENKNKINNENNNTINIQHNKNINSNRNNEKNTVNINNININSNKLIYKNSYSNKKYYQTNGTYTINVNKANNVNDENIKFQSIDNDHHAFNRGKSEYNLKIDTNNMNIFSSFKQRHKFREKSFNKTASCDRIIINNNYINNKNIKNNFNHNINSNSNRKTIQKDKRKNNFDFDIKLIQWINKNYKNKNKNNSSTKFNLNKSKSNIKKNKFIRQGSLLNLNSNNIYNNIIIKNNNFPCVNSINMSNSPIKKIFELNDINSNKKQLKYNRSNFNTINSSKYLVQVQSARSIHKKTNNSKNKKMLSQNTFSPFSPKKNKNTIKTKTSSLFKNRFKKPSKNLFSIGYNKYNNYKPKNTKLEFYYKGINSKNDINKEKINLENIKSM